MNRQQLKAAYRALRVQNKRACTNGMPAWAFREATGRELTRPPSRWYTMKYDHIGIVIAIACDYDPDIMNANPRMLAVERLSKNADLLHLGYVRYTEPPFHAYGYYQE